MRKNLAFLTFLLLAAMLGVSAQTSPAAFVRTSTGPSYAELVARLKSGDSGIDFRALRMKYTETKDYDPAGLSPELRDRMYKAINEKKFAGARSMAESILKKNYVDISAHLVAGIANQALGDTAKFEFHRQVFLGLIASIIDSGDGRSRETSLAVISAPEEYAVLDYLKFARTSQFSASGDGRMYDVLSVTDKETGGALKLYFNVDIIWKARNKSLKN
jgi:hypothetical protein